MGSEHQDIVHRDGSGVMELLLHNGGKQRKEGARDKNPLMTCPSDLLPPASLPNWEVSLKT